jgi:hypothetical protein
MTFKFYRSVLSALVLLAGPVLAAPPDPGVDTDSGKKKPKEGYVRFWNLLPKGKDELKLVKPSGAEEGDTLIVAEPLNYYAGYQPLTVGRYSLKVVRTAEPKTALQTFDVLLREDVFVTFIAKLKDNKITVEMIDDTYDHDTATTGQVIVRQQFPEANVIVTSKTGARSQAISYGNEETMNGFPLQLVNITLNATLADGKHKSASMEVDFRASRHASLIVIADGYGRFRVRLASNGQKDK